ncbi:MAG: hypothetical protein IKU34_12335 [Clostridia bacterium]|nr:hypothetical protein [Clostridia bacterium]
MSKLMVMEIEDMRVVLEVMRNERISGEYDIDKAERIREIADKVDRMLAREDERDRRFREMEAVL